MTDHTELLITRSADVMHLTMQRGAKGNALSATLVHSLMQAVDSVYAEQVRLLVLAGAGKHFCTGFDLSNLDQESDDSLLARFTRVEFLLHALHAAPFMTRALAHGRATGAGADLVCACSERWVIGETSFAFPGASFGLVLGTARLADIVGPTQAREWVEGGATIDEQAALAADLATRQFAPEALCAELPRLKERVRRLDAPTQRAIHEAIDTGRRRRGDAGDAQDLLRLVRSAARPGLKERIASYRALQQKSLNLQNKFILHP